MLFPLLLLQTRDILTSTTFADLTNCSAKCTVQDTNFGTVPDPLAGTKLEWTSPTVGAPRLNDNTCDLSGPPFNSSPTRWELTEPTILDERAQSCSATYKTLLVGQCLADVSILEHTMYCMYANRWNINSGSGRGLIAHANVIGVMLLRAGPHGLSQAPGRSIL